MRKEAAKLLVAVRKGERVPIRTRIFLFDDSVTVDDFVMNKTQQYVTLRTTRKHTFRNGVSRHQFFTLPGFSNQLLFVNCGEGESEVPFFGPINNRVASPAIQLAQEHIVLFDRSEKATKRVGEDLFAFRCVQELLQKALEAKWEDIKPQEKSEFIDRIFPHLSWGLYTRLNPIFLGENSITSLWIDEVMVAQLARPNALAASQNLYEIVEEEQ